VLKLRLKISQPPSWIKGVGGWVGLNTSSRDSLCCPKGGVFKGGQKVWVGGEGKSNFKDC
jgi:hypothetical protein